MNTHPASTAIPAGAADGLGNLLRDNPIALAIIGCEIAFWLVLGAGLAVRYLLRRRRLSTALLLAVPLVDVVLLVLVALDLGRGAVATNVHSLAGVYLGVSVAFGHRIIRWADVRVAHRFAGGPPPAPKPKTGPESAAHEWRTFGLVLIGAAIAAATLLALRYLVAGPETGAALTERLPWLGIAVGLWFIFGPVWESGRAATSRVKT